MKGLILVIMLLVACSGTENNANNTNNDNNTNNANNTNNTNNTNNINNTNNVNNTNNTNNTNNNNMMSVALNFEARVGADAFSCGTTYPGLGTTAANAEIKDFRFYVSNVRMIDANGGETEVVLTDDDVWQDANVALLDFEDGTGGCAETGNSALNSQVVGTVANGTYTDVAFDIGVPFAVNHVDLAIAQTPLNIDAMYWVWQGGYKFIRIDYLTDASDAWNVHLGSTMCASGGPMEPPAAECGRPNRFHFQAPFDPASQTIIADAAALIATSDIAANTIDTPPGCQSFPADVNECDGVFAALGLDYMTGECAAGDCTTQTFLTIE